MKEYFNFISHIMTPHVIFVVSGLELPIEVPSVAL